MFSALKPRRESQPMWLRCLKLAGRPIEFLSIFFDLFLDLA